MPAHPAISRPASRGSCATGVAGIPPCRFQDRLGAGGQGVAGSNPVVPTVLTQARGRSQQSPSAARPGPTWRRTRGCSKRCASCTRRRTRRRRPDSGAAPCGHRAAAATAAPARRRRQHGRPGRARPGRDRHRRLGHRPWPGRRSSSAIRSATFSRRSVNCGSGPIRASRSNAGRPGLGAVRERGGLQHDELAVELRVGLQSAVLRGSEPLLWWSSGINAAQRWRG
jgi:hypothetical protein